MTDKLFAESEAAALEQLHAQGLTDGLPVVIPTDERVARMVLCTGQAAELTLGDMGPAGGSATIEKIAVAAVMAGCLPDHMPVVIAAIEAIINPAFDLTEMQATTHCTAPLILGMGPREPRVAALPLGLARWGLAFVPTRVSGAPFDWQ